jgi:hypothetical protein
MKNDGYLSIVEVENPPPRRACQDGIVRVLSPFGLIVDVAAGSITHQMCDNPTVFIDKNLGCYGDVNPMIAAEYLAYHEFWEAFTTLIESDEAIRTHIQLCRSISVTRFDVGVVQILDCHSQIKKAENICLILDSRKAAEDALRDI